MSYDVDFVGLVCFYRQEDGSRLALLPDGRTPPADIARHVARIVVPADRVISGTDWEGTVSLLDRRMEFELPKCVISMSGAHTDSPPALDVSKHDDRLPNLKKLDPKFAIVPSTAQAIVQFPINQGRLEAFRRPGSNDTDENVAIVTRLNVSYDANITIEVLEDGFEVPRTIVLLPNTEIVISNIETPDDAEKPGKHIRLYERLSSNAVDLSNVTVNDLDSLGDPRMHSTHPFFDVAKGIGSGADCGNTGCCPNPGGP